MDGGWANLRIGEILRAGGRCSVAVHRHGIPANAAYRLSAASIDRCLGWALSAALARWGHRVGIAEGWWEALIAGRLPAGRTGSWLGPLAG